MNPIVSSFDLFLAGAIGALAKDVVVDNSLELPSIKDKRIFLGFIGGALVGAVIGFYIDGSFSTALMAGYTGSSLLGKVLVKTEKGPLVKK